MTWRIFRVPAVPGAVLDDLQWPGKDASDVLPFGWDLTDVLGADLPLTLTGAKVQYTPDLTVSDPQFIETAGVPTGILLEKIGGGTPGQTSGVCGTIYMQNGDGSGASLTLRMGLPINGTDPNSYAAQPVLTGSPLTIGGQEIDVGGQALTAG